MMDHKSECFCHMEIRDEDICGASGLLELCTLTTTATWTHREASELQQRFEMVEKVRGAGSERLDQDVATSLACSWSRGWLAWVRGAWKAEEA